MRTMSLVRACLLIAATTSAVSCGFDPQPRSGTLACNPGGSGCCPDGYLCAGRGASTPEGLTTGTCWNRKDLPAEAVANVHDHTPAVTTDPACLVTDWLPPLTSEPLDGGGAALDGGPNGEGG